MSNVINSVVSFAATGTFFPSDGMGGSRATARGTTTGATSTYTDTTVTDSAFNTTTAGIAVGDYAYTSDGYYGVVTEFVAGAGGTVTVRKWILSKRSRASSVTGKPLTGTATTTFYPSIHIGEYTRVRVKRLIIANPVDGTVAIGDQKAAALVGHTFAVSTVDPPSSIDLDLDVDTPFCVIVGTGATGGSVEFEAMK